MDAHDPRDHLALERTFLAYLRTSNAIILFAVALAQLYILRDGAFVLGKVMSSITVGVGIFVALLGGAHFMRQQQALVRGKVVSEGEILLSVFVLVGTVSGLDRSLLRGEKCG
ncbi:MAG: hypothetical protein M1836_002214 [Candelina mexicana]|nr:MAG: hypothetical protein M1836_002214 [Candelina mexicana]